MKSMSTTRLIKTLSIRISLHQVLYQFDFIAISLLPFETEMHQMQLFHRNSLSCQISHQNTHWREAKPQRNETNASIRQSHRQTVLNAHPDLHGVPHATSHLPKHVKWRSICSSKVEKSHHVVGSAKSLSAKLKHWADISLGHSLRSYHHTRPMKVKVVKWCRKKWNEHNPKSTNAI